MTKSDEPDFEFGCCFLYQYRELIKMEIYRKQSTKPIKRFIHDLEQSVRINGFTIHNEETMEMVHTFARHEAEVPKGFDLHMVQICKPDKASKSLSKNLERAVLMPKFIMIFSHKGETQIRFLYFNRDTVKNIVADEEFPASLESSYSEIIAMIDETA